MEVSAEVLNTVDVGANRGRGEVTASQFAGGSFPKLVTMVFCAGFFVIGGHVGLNAFASQLYPTYIRSTGLGWALGCGPFRFPDQSYLGGLVPGLALASDQHFLHGCDTCFSCGRDYISGWHHGTTGRLAGSSDGATSGGHKAVALH